MAEGKKSVLLYCDLLFTVEKMDDETAGKFFKHYLNYINDNDPITDNLVVDIAFESVKQNLKRDLKKWEKRAEASRSNGSKGGRPKGKIKLYDRGGIEVPETSNEGHFVYLIYDNVRCEFKIGETKNLIKRRQQIKEPTINLDIFCFGMADAYTCQKIERQILIDYEDDRVGGDWLNITEEEAKEIKKYISQETQQVNNYPRKPVTDTVTVTVTDTVSKVDSTTVNTVDFDNLLKYINKTFGREFRKINNSVKDKYKARIKEGYTTDDIRSAINGCKKDAYHIETNFKYCTPDYFSRAKTIDLHSSVGTPEESSDPLVNYAKQQIKLYGNS